MVVNGNNQTVNNGGVAGSPYGYAFVNCRNVVMNDIDVINGGGVQLSNATVVFNGGKIANTHPTYIKGPRYNFICFANDTLTINDGTFTVGTLYRRIFIYAEGNAIVYVKGGNWGVPDLSDNRKGEPIRTVGNAKVFITGGTFAWDPSNSPIINEGESTDEIVGYKNYVAEGYKAVYNDNDKTWKVVKAVENE